MLGDRLLVAEAKARELRARRDPELGEDVSQVVVDRPRGQEEVRRDLLVREAVGDEPRDLQLLWRQVVDRARVALPRRLARRAQLGACAFGPRFRAEALEALEGPA